MMDVNQSYCNDHFTMYTDIELGCAPETNIMPIISQFLKRQTWPYTHKVYMQAWEDTQLMKEYT